MEIDEFIRWVTGGEGDEEPTSLLPHSPDSHEGKPRKLNWHTGPKKAPEVTPEVIEVLTRKMRAAAYTARGVDLARLFRCVVLAFCMC